MTAEYEHAQNGDLDYGTRKASGGGDNLSSVLWTVIDDRNKQACLGPERGGLQIQSGN